MSKLNALLTSRFKKASETLSKMTELGDRSNSGALSSFSGVFRVTPLSFEEEEKLRALLSNYKNETQEIESDLKELLSLTSEVRAINNQAAILHGERIKKAQTLLKSYRDGAFSAWLICSYGNRQTPYNFLQYYELYQQIHRSLHPKLDEMPRQAVYTLASRHAPLEEKEEIVKNYKGEPKAEILALIRRHFPLATHDKRGDDLAAQALTALKKVASLLKERRFRPTKEQKEAIRKLAEEISHATG